MRYGPGHKAETRERILEAAERAFRTHGYAGVGVDGLAAEAGITSGAFYGHFRSKAEVFRAAAAAGLLRLRRGIEDFHAGSGPGWVRPFMQAYLAPPFRQGQPGGCALPSLGAEVARADAPTRSCYEAEMLRLVEALAANLPSDSDADAPARQRAWAMLALLSGGATLARAVEDAGVALEIAAAVTDTVVRVAGEDAAAPCQPPLGSSP